jgi:hypothetical protein
VVECNSRLPQNMTVPIELCSVQQLEGTLDQLKWHWSAVRMSTRAMSAVPPR